MNAPILLMIVTIFTYDADVVPVIDLLTPERAESYVCDEGSLYKVNDDETRTVQESYTFKDGATLEVSYCSYIDMETGKRW